MRTPAVERAGSVPASPVYQITLSAAVPATSAVAVSNGGPSTRIGGLFTSALKNSLPAAMAEAAASAPPATLPTAVVSVACKLAAVAAAFAPMVNSFGPGVAEFVAVSVRSVVVPSGRVKDSLMLSPATGLVAPRSIETEGGAPAGPVTVAPVRVDVAAASFRPKS